MKRHTPINVPRTAESLNIVFCVDGVSTSSSGSGSSLEVITVAMNQNKCNSFIELILYSFS